MVTNYDRIKDSYINEVKTLDVDNIISFIYNLYDCERCPAYGYCITIPKISCKQVLKQWLQLESEG